MEALIEKTALEQYLEKEQLLDSQSTMADGRQTQTVNAVIDYWRDKQTNAVIDVRVGIERQLPRQILENAGWIPLLTESQAQDIAVDAELVEYFANAKGYYHPLGKLLLHEQAGSFKQAGRMSLHTVSQNEADILVRYVQNQRLTPYQAGSVNGFNYVESVWLENVINDGVKAETVALSNDPFINFCRDRDIMGTKNQHPYGFYESYTIQGKIDVKFLDIGFTEVEDEVLYHSGTLTNVHNQFAKWTALHSIAEYNALSEYATSNNMLRSDMRNFKARHFMLESERSILSVDEEERLTLYRFSNVDKLRQFAKSREIAPCTRYADHANDPDLEDAQPEYLWLRYNALAKLKHVLGKDRITSHQHNIENTPPTITPEKNNSGNTDKKRHLEQFNVSNDAFIKFINYEGLLTEEGEHEEGCMLYKVDGLMTIECVARSGDNGKLTEKVLFTSHDETQQRNNSFKDWVPLHERERYESMTERGCEFDTVLKYSEAYHFVLENENLLLSITNNDTMELRQFSKMENLRKFANDKNIAPYEKYAYNTNDAWLDEFDPHYLWMNDEDIAQDRMAEDMYKEHLKQKAAGGYDHESAKTQEQKITIDKNKQAPDIKAQAQQWVKAVNWHQVEAVDAPELDSILKIQKNVRLLNDQQQHLEKKLHKEVATLLQKPASRKAIEKLPEPQRKLFLAQEKSLGQAVERGVSHGF